MRLRHQTRKERAEKVQEMVQYLQAVFVGRTCDLHCGYRQLCECTFSVPARTIQSIGVKGKDDPLCVVLVTALGQPYYWHTDIDPNVGTAGRYATSSALVESLTSPFCPNEKLYLEISPILQRVQERDSLLSLAVALVAGVKTRPLLHVDRVVALVRQYLYTIQNPSCPYHATFCTTTKPPTAIPEQPP